MISVLIPTKGRPKKLQRCLDSIPSHIHVAIHATSNGDIPEKNHPNTSITIGPENIVQSFNLLAYRTATPFVLPATDDVKFSTGYFDHLQTFADSNPEALIIGSHVTNRKHNNDTFMLVSRVAINERGFLFDPRFEHFFVDSELGLWAKQRSSFQFCKDATLEHFHPEISGEFDATHNHRRMDKWRHDKAIWDEIKGSSPILVAAIQKK